MKSIKEGWLTTAIGIVLIVLSILVGFGLIATTSTLTFTQLTVIFIAGLVLVRMPKTVEGILKKLISKKIGHEV
jgi:hypothetical protein